MLNEKRKALAELEAQIKAKQAEIDGFEYESTDSDYDDYLNESGPVNVCGCTFYPADILKELDPTAYRTGKNDFDDGKDLDDVPEYVELTDELQELEDSRDDLESEIEELEEAEESEE